MPDRVDDPTVSPVACTAQVGGCLSLISLNYTPIHLGSGAVIRLGERVCLFYPSCNYFIVVRYYCLFSVFLCYDTRPGEGRLAEESIWGKALGNAIQGVDRFTLLMLCTSCTVT